jgi:hypothetical protein
MRGWWSVALAGAVAASVVAALASAAGERDALIRPGVAIGGISLGMTPAQVSRVRARPSERRVEARGFGVRYTELSWLSGLADRLTVGILGRPGAERVVLVETTALAERTAGGIGPGVPMTRVRNAFPNVQCRQTETPGGFLDFQWVSRHPTGAETVFVTGGWTGHTGRRFDGRYSAKNVAAVTVRAREARPATRPC